MQLDSILMLEASVRLLNSFVELQETTVNELWRSRMDEK